MNYTFKKFDPNQHKNIWNELYQNLNSTFLTNLDWINFQKSLVKKIDQLIVFENNEPFGILSIESSVRKIAKYAYLAHNPVVKDFTDGFLLELFKFGKEYAKTNKLNYFKIDPLLELNEKSKLKKAGFKKSLSPGQAKDSWILNLKNDNGESYSSEELLQKQKKDNRYYVRRAAKKGVEVRKIESEKQIKDFYSLMSETMGRQGFINHSYEYFEKQWIMLNQDLDQPICEIFVAYFEDTPVSGALVNYSNNSLHYSHGASTSNKKLSNLASPYLLQWKIIEDGLQKELDYYDFWGVVPKDLKDHPFRGLSDFKMKFDGNMIRRVGTWEVSGSSLKYLINRAFDWWAFRKERY